MILVLWILLILVSLGLHSVWVSERSTSCIVSPQQVHWRGAWCSWCSIWKGLFEDDFQFGSLEARERHLSYLRVTRTKWPFLATATHWASQFEADTMGLGRFKNKNRKCTGNIKQNIHLATLLGLDLIYIAFVQLINELCSKRLSVLRSIIVGQETNFKSWSEWHEKCDSTRIKL